jgi:putative peptidoglycan lipid II flippase
VTLAVGVPAFMMVKVLASGFYARQDISTPVKVGALAMLINTILCFLLVWTLAHAGLTLASALAGYVNCGILVYLLIRRGLYIPAAGWKRYALQLVLANSAIAAYLSVMAGTVDYWLQFSALTRFSFLLAHVLVTIVIYALVLVVLGVRPAQFRGQIKE